METFNINGISNSYVYANPNPKAKYGLAFSFWYSNVNDMLFACELMRREWINQDLIEISIGSFAALTDEQIERFSKVVNYIVKVDENRFHQDGTTTNCNAAMQPLMQNENLITVAHSDADVPWINQTYFFGFSQMLMDAGKFILTSQDTFLYDEKAMRSRVYGDHDILQTRQFGSMFVVDRKRAMELGYFPLSMEGHFERDRFLHFERLGLNVEKDAIILKRTPIDYDIPSNFLYSFDFNLGVVHQTNMLEHPENTDRKLRMLQLMFQDRWDDITLGWKGNFNPKSPRTNYGPAPVPE
jgi:hypothetical protein